MQESEMLTRNNGELTTDIAEQEDEMEQAAEALRAAEVEAVQPGDTIAEFPAVDTSKLTAASLEAMSIDEVRAIANTLDVPERSKITDKAVLIEEILRRI
jgi:hypothetical protein